MCCPDRVPWENLGLSWAINTLYSTKTSLWSNFGSTTAKIQQPAISTKKEFPLDGTSAFKHFLAGAISTAVKCTDRLSRIKTAQQLLLCKLWVSRCLRKQKNIVFYHYSPLFSVIAKSMLTAHFRLNPHFALSNNLRQVCCIAQCTLGKKA